MAKQFDHKAIEKKWQARWEKEKLYETNIAGTGKEKMFVLDMFPYPSGEGLHVGHPKGYIATDIYSRFKKMNGYEILHPMGWDAFGLPAENFAIKHKIHPRIAVERNIANFKEQLAHLGFNYDWNHEINTTDPEYYKWTQWIFLKLLEKGLAYQSHEPINWCPGCQTGLSNEDVESDGTCERCDSKVEKRPMRQWILRITAYADRMLEDLETLAAWPPHIKEAQRNWIGRSEGAEIDFELSFTLHPELNAWRDPAGKPAHVAVFTTRVDTIYGATALILAPEHPWIRALWDTAHNDAISNKDAIAAYVAQAQAKNEIERTDATKQKTGLKIDGMTAINPATKEHIPVFVADYVLAHYGTGAIMAVPAHDDRDFAFAHAHGCEVKEVIQGEDTLPRSGEGVLIHSGEFDGMHSREAKKAIAAKVGGRSLSTYRLNDWVFSRQRYWGEPIPVIHCEQCGVVPVPYDQLPVRLPEVEHYEPTGTGESPLAGILDWVNVPCPTCGGMAKRETNTMPQWAGSSWYYLRFIDPKNDRALIDPEKEKRWAPVDVYVGGDHAVRHLIYARFWHKFLYDIGVVHTIEPFMRLEFLGFILAEDGRKMSKRWGNIINPDTIVQQNGADTLRIYEMFMGPFENTVAWSTNGLVGAQRFLERVNSLSDHTVSKETPALTSLLHRTVKKVSDDIEAFKFNTAISTLMIYVNAAEKEGLAADSYRAFLRILAPFAPHLAEELWEQTGKTSSIHTEDWPKADKTLTETKEVTIAVQFNGKARETITIAKDATEEDALEAVKANPGMQKRLVGMTIAKVIYVPGRALNLILK